MRRLFLCLHTKNIKKYLCNKKGFLAKKNETTLFIKNHDTIAKLKNENRENII